MINPMWIPMRVSWCITGALPIYFLVNGNIMASISSYVIIFLPISMFCDWIENPPVTGKQNGVIR